MKKVLILSAYTVIFGLALPAGVLGLGLFLDRRAGLPDLPASGAVGVFPLALGALVWTAGARELARVGGGPPVSALPPARLVESGPFFYLRHPLYVGFHLLLLGAALALRSTGCLIMAGPMFLGLWLGYALLYEEPALRRRFGAAYRRYAAETGILLPTLPAVARFVAVPVLRLFFGLRLRGHHALPHVGGILLFGLHRSYLDPLLLSVGLSRKVHFLTTVSMFRSPMLSLLFRGMGCIPLRRYAPDPAAIGRAMAVLSHGGVVGIFPEGGRSWAGETICDRAALRLMERAGVPAVGAWIEGAYEYYPRFAARPRPRALTVRYHVWNPMVTGRRATGQQAERRVAELVSREHRWSLCTAARRTPQRSTGIETVLYACPVCRALFSLRGSRTGEVRCARCGQRFVLVEGRTLVLPDGTPTALRDLCEEQRSLASQAALHMVFPGTVSVGSAGCTDSPRAESTQGMLVLRPDEVEIRTQGHHVRRVPSDAMDSVLIEGRRNIEIYWRPPAAGRELLRFRVAQRHSLFLQQDLRIRAFGDAHQRRRDSLRQRVGPRCGGSATGEGPA